MIIFYIIMSIIFALLSFMISRANDNSTKTSVLLGIFFLVLWPVVMAAITVYLFIAQVKHSKHTADIIEDEVTSTSIDAEPLNWSKISEETEEPTNNQ